MYSVILGQDSHFGACRFAMNTALNNRGGGEVLLICSSIIDAYAL